MRGRAPDGNPFESSGQETFQSGDKFQLDFLSSTKGYLYIINQGPTDRDEPSLTMIYPRRDVEQGTAKLEANYSVSLTGLTFTGPPGTEQFWMIWSTTPIGELEAAREAAFASKAIRLRDETVIQKVRDYLSSHSRPEPEAKTDDTNKTVIVGNVDPLVKLLKLKHE
jgi:hypothetical protein